MDPVWLCSPLPPPYDLTLITHTKPKPKDGESYRQWSPNPVPDPRLRRSDRAASNPSPMNLVWSCSPSHPPCNLASRSNLVASTTRSRRLSLFLLLSIWPDLMNFFFWVLFLLCFSIEEWYYIFVWKLRKCEQQVENMFSMVFSRTQPNTRKYFSKHFLKCNQTRENILHLENILHWNKCSLSHFHCTFYISVQINNHFVPLNLLWLTSNNYLFYEVGSR